MQLRLSRHLFRAAPIRNCHHRLGVFSTRTFESASLPSLAENEVHIHWALADQLSESSLQQLHCCLTDVESTAVNNTADAQLRRQKLLARGLTRSILPGYILGGCSSQDLEFCKNGHGKPYIAAKHFPGGSGCDIDFNLTHTHSIVGCAVGRGVSVGLDVEEVGRRPRNMLRLAKRRFSPAEYNMLAGAGSEEERVQLFLQLWTLKEALVKARGTGINCPPGLAGFSMGLQKDTAAAEQVLHSWRMAPASDPLRISLSSESLPEGSARFDFLLMQPSPAHIAALCILRPGPAHPPGFEQQHTHSWRAVPTPTGPEPPTCPGSVGDLHDEQAATSWAAKCQQQQQQQQQQQHEQHVSGMAVPAEARPLPLVVKTFELVGAAQLRRADERCTLLGCS